MLRATCTLTAIGLLFAATAADPPVPVLVVEDHVIDCVEGMVERLDLENEEFTLKVGEKLRTFQIDNSTLYYIDDKLSTRELVLVVGKTVTVTHTEGLAERVVGTLEEA